MTLYPDTVYKKTNLASLCTAVTFEERNHFD